jgi:hypothetical protein
MTSTTEPQERRTRREQADVIEDALRKLFETGQLPEQERRTLTDVDAATLQRVVQRLL